MNKLVAINKIRKTLFETIIKSILPRNKNMTKPIDKLIGAEKKAANLFNEI